METYDFWRAYLNSAHNKRFLPKNRPSTHPRHQLSDRTNFYKQVLFLRKPIIFNNSRIPVTQEPKVPDSVQLQQLPYSKRQSLQQALDRNTLSFINPHSSTTSIPVREKVFSNWDVFYAILRFYVHIKLRFQFYLPIL